MYKKELEKRDGKYIFDFRKISRSDFQKIAHGTWSDLSIDQIHKKLNYKQKLAGKKVSYVDLYESALRTPQGQYYLGVAQEKIVNDLKKYLQEIITESRRLVKNNKGKV